MPGSVARKATGGFPIFVMLIMRRDRGRFRLDLNLGFHVQLEFSVNGGPAVV